MFSNSAAKVLRVSAVFLHREIFFEKKNQARFETNILLDYLLIILKNT